MFYSSNYFGPINVSTNKKDITNNTLAIHWYNSSWYTPQKIKHTTKKS